MPHPQRLSLYSLLLYLTGASLVRLGCFEQRQVDRFQQQRDRRRRVGGRMLQRDEGEIASFTTTISSTHPHTSTLQNKNSYNDKPFPLEERQWLKPKAMSSSPSSTILESMTIHNNKSKQPHYDYHLHGDDHASTNSKLVVAGHPHDMYHVLAIWTQLECFASNMNTVVVSAPIDTKDIVNTIAEFAKHRIPHFVSDKVDLQVVFDEKNDHDNVEDRFDNGLWCQALSHPSEQDENATFFELSNDSVFALRPYHGLLEAIQEASQQHKDYPIMKSLLEYTTTTRSSSKNLNIGETNNRSTVRVLESSYRGYNREAMHVFQEQVCPLPPSHTYYCPELWNPVHASPQREGCVKQRFEVALSKALTQYVDNTLMANGLWPQGNEQELPNSFHNADDYAEYLLKQQDFPALFRSTAKRWQLVGNGESRALLDQCTQYWSMKEEALLQELLTNLYTAKTYARV